MFQPTRIPLKKTTRGQNFIISMWLRIDVQTIWISRASEFSVEHRNN